MRNRWSGLLPRPWALGIVLGLMACGSDNDEFLTVDPPLTVRTIYPESGVEGFVGHEVLSVTFDRPATAGTVIMELFPMPAQSGAYGPTGSGRNWAWEGIEFVAEDGAYAWMIDGYLMAQPLIVRFASGERQSIVGFEGEVDSQDRTAVAPEGTVLYALPDDAGFNPLDPATFLEARSLALSAVVAIDLDPVLDGPAIHRIGFLQPGKGYVVVAVKDTNNDLIYDPTTDWWGYFAESVSLAPQIVYAATFFSLDYMADVNVMLRPPAAP